MNSLKSIVGLLALLLLLSACVSSPKDNGDQSDQTVDKDDEVSEVDKENSGEEADAQELVLDDFPEDVYIPLNATLTKSIVTDENSIMLTYEVPGKMVDDQDNYKNFLTDKGYTMNEINMSDQMIVFQGTKIGDHFLYYSLVGQEDTSYTLKIEYGK
ncbi:hypothetical protein ACFSFY_12610 [Sporosarcina siberiensis]|uniref:Lipoprotein n=1 Tax=Sporosarcina siberiensis TaxID=1365606 RepID=A0ABW4SIN8_9BACL